MKITGKEIMILGALGVGLFALRDRNYDINRDGNKDEKDKGLIIFLGALAVLYLI